MLVESVVSLVTVCWLLVDVEEKRSGGNKRGNSKNNEKISQKCFVCAMREKLRKPSASVFERCANSQKVSSEAVVF